MANVYLMCVCQCLSSELPLSPVVCHGLFSGLKLSDRWSAAAYRKVILFIDLTAKLYMDVWTRSIKLPTTTYLSSGHSSSFNEAVTVYLYSTVYSTVYCFACLHGGYCLSDIVALFIRSQLYNIAVAYQIFICRSVKFNDWDISCRRFLVKYLL